MTSPVTKPAPPWMVQKWTVHVECSNFEIVEIEAPTKRLAMERAERLPEFRHYHEVHAYGAERDPQPIKQFVDKLVGELKSDADP